MKHIKLFEEFKSHQEIDDICTKYKIKNYTINDDGSIDVNGDVNISSQKLKELPLKFRNIYGFFDCSNNHLTSLKGAPIKIVNTFYCEYNKLTSLEGAPSSIGGCFAFGSNNVYSFNYFPDFVGGEIILPTKLNYIFSLFKNKELIDAFNDYNIIKAPKNPDDMPRLKVSNLNSFLTDNGFKELEDTSKLEKYYDLK